MFFPLQNDAFAFDFLQRCKRCKQTAMCESCFAGHSSIPVAMGCLHFTMHRSAAGPAQHALSHREVVIEPKHQIDWISEPQCGGTDV